MPSQAEAKVMAALLLGHHHSPDIARAAGMKSVDATLAKLERDGKVHSTWDTRYVPRRRYYTRTDQL